MTVYTPKGAWGASIGWLNADSGRLVGWLSPHPKPGDEFHSPMEYVADLSRRGVFA